MHDSRDRDVARFLGLPAAAFYILISLADDDRHGYAIMQDVAERSGGRTKLNPGTLYTTLRRLVSDGLITELEERPASGKDDERRRYYRLNPFGRRVLQAEAARLEELATMARKAVLLPKRA